MSKLVCKNCKSIAVDYEDYTGGTSYYRCKTCGMRGNKDKFTSQTLFDRITASPEVLAERLVLSFPFVDCEGQVIIAWYSTVKNGRWFTKKEAVAATVAKLKEEVDGTK